MNRSGILRKWADKYGVTIKVQRFDYAPSLDAFVAKNIDACTMTNMEALDMPAASGVPTTVVLIGDYSNGNDALLVRNGLQMKDLTGKKMLLVQKTVSEYLFHRGMTMAGLKDQIKGVRMINTSDADLAGAFIGDASVSAAVTWKPLVSQIQKQPGVTSLFNFVADPRRDPRSHGGPQRRLEPPRGTELRQGARRRLVRSARADERDRPRRRQGADGDR
jgi:NitT/TauT family transport system substrate-binding protein